MSNDDVQGPSRKAAKLWFVAKRSCMPGIMGAAVCVLAMIVIGTVGFSSFFATYLPASLSDQFSVISPSSLDDLANQVRGRFAWGLSAIIMTMATIGVTIVSWNLVTEAFNNTWRDLRGVVLTITFATAGIGFIAALVSQTVQCDPSRCDLLSLLLNKLDVDYEMPLWLLPAILNSSVVSTTVLLGVSFSSLTIPPAPNQRDTIADLVDRIHWLRRLLYVSAACLVTRVMEVYALYMWPISYLTKNEAVPLINIAMSTSVAVGVIYSVFLVSVYAPAATILYSRVGKTAAFSGLPNLDGVLREYGIASTPLHEIARILTLLAPVILGFLQGPVASMIGNILKEVSSN